ncbi:MAG: type II toxin-antitoxin system VapB family antitoxin [Acidimicrobiales bacterium]
MSLNIKSSEAEGLARALAGTTGETLTLAVTIALRERLDRLQGQRGAEVAERADRLRRIGEDAATRWVEPYRSAEHGVLLYDERGLAR